MIHRINPAMNTTGRAEPGSPGPQQEEGQGRAASLMLPRAFPAEPPPGRSSLRPTGQNPGLEGWISAQGWGQEAEEGRRKDREREKQTKRHSGETREAQAGGSRGWAGRGGGGVPSFPWRALTLTWREIPQLLRLLASRGEG